MTQENHRNSTRLLQHETWYYNGSRVLSVTECNVWACTLVYEVSLEKTPTAKQETKLIIENFIGGIPLWAMASLNHLIGWD